jgi:hypothetical protein
MRTEKNAFPSTRTVWPLGAVNVLATLISYCGTAGPDHSKTSRSKPGLCAARIAVRVEAASGEPPVSVVQAMFGVPPGLVVAVGAGVGLGVGGAVVGTGVGVRDGVTVGGAVVGAGVVGAGVTRTVSGPQVAVTIEVSRKSAIGRPRRRLICRH